MDFNPLNFIIYPIVFLIGIFIGWVTQRYRINALKERLEDKSFGLRDAQKQVAKVREEQRLFTTQITEADERTAEREKAAALLKTEIQSMRKQLAARDAVWRERLELLQEEFAKKEHEFSRISAVTTGFAPLRTQLQRREEEVGFLQMQVQQILAMQHQGSSEENLNELSASLIAQSTFRAEIARLQKRIGELETELKVAHEDEDEDEPGINGNGHSRKANEHTFNNLTKMPVAELPEEIASEFTDEELKTLTAVIKNENSEEAVAELAQTSSVNS